MDDVFDVPAAPWVAVSPALATVRRAVLALTVAPAVAVVLAAMVVFSDLLVVWLPALVGVLGRRGPTPNATRTCSCATGS